MPNLKVIALYRLLAFSMLSLMVQSNAIVIVVWAKKLQKLKIL